MLARLFNKSHSHEDAANRLYLRVVAQARQSHLYAQYGVPDTVEGRFDAIMLHAWLVLRRLSRVSEAAKPRSKPLAQALFDTMFADMDRNLREMGVTDTGIGKRIRRMTEDFQGRIVAYDRAIDLPDHDLIAALQRNLFQSADTLDGADVKSVADYVRRQVVWLQSLNDADLLGGVLSFDDGRPA